MCKYKFLTVKELSVLLDRDIKNIRDRYIKDLVKTGKLELRYPNNINQPNQAYKTNENIL